MANGVLADHGAVLEHDDPIGVGADLHRTTDRLGRDAVAVALEAYEAGLRHRHRRLGVAVEGALPRHERGALLL